MAELRFEAPLASFENEEWNDQEDTCDGKLYKSGPCNDSGNKDNHQSKGDAENFRELCSGSLEDLVTSFDEKISNCFCNFEEQVEKIAPVQVRSQEEILNDCQMWWTITGNYGSILPINWSTDYKQQPNNKVLHLRDTQDYGYTDYYISDEEELPQDFDMHSLIVASLHHEDEDKVETADDVIRQIEHMLKDPKADDEEEEKTEAVEDEQHLKLKAMLEKLPSYTEQELKGLTCTELRGVVEEQQQAVRVLSEVLACDQALQDDLDYGKELKNSFISILLAIQKKIRDTHAQPKKKKNRAGHTNRHSGGGGAETEESSSFLTTAIPYYPHDGPPTSEQLQIYIKILDAISQDSSTVPTLLTDYILKVLCPSH